MASKPVQRTIKHYQQLGFVIGIVEKYNSFVGAMIKGKSVECPECHAKVETRKPAGIRQDLWGFADLIMYVPGDEGVTLVQCGAATDHADHRAKILDSDLAKDWLSARGRDLILVSWGEYAPREPKLKKDGSPVLRKGVPVMSFKTDKAGKRLPKVWTPRIEIFNEEDWGDPF